MGASTRCNAAREAQEVVHSPALHADLDRLRGQGELKTLSKIDAGAMQHLSGDRLLLGMYINELLVRLLGKYVPAPVLFRSYQALLLGLVGDEQYTTELRKV